MPFLGTPPITAKELARKITTDSDPTWDWGQRPIKNLYKCGSTERLGNLAVTITQTIETLTEHAEKMITDERFSNQRESNLQENGYGQPARFFPVSRASRTSAWWWPIQVTGSTPFQRMDNLFRAVVAVPKAEIDRVSKNGRRPTGRSGRKRRSLDVTARQKLRVEIKIAKMRYAWAKEEVKRGDPSPALVKYLEESLQELQALRSLVTRKKGAKH
jgi:hypothetical protein